MAFFTSITNEVEDLAERAVQRTLLQFRQSPVFLDLLQAFIQEVQYLQGGINGVFDLREPANATAENLNAIGRIVGQIRTILDYSELEWFTPDALGLTCDQAPAWVQGALTGGSYEAGDEWYRRLIEGKVFRNFCRYSSVPEIQNVIKLAFGIDVSFRVVAPMEVDIIFPASAPLWVVNLITRFADDGYSDDVAFAPFPATLRINSVQYVDDSSSS